MSRWKWLTTRLHNSTRNRIVAPFTSTSTERETLVELQSEKIQTDSTCMSAYEFYNILRDEKAVDWCEWHLNITENDNVIKTAEKFHQNYETLELSSSIHNDIDIIEKTFLDLMPINKDWNEIRELFRKANKEENPLRIIESYTTTQEFSRRLNKDSAANTYHTLKLYCTLLNCPILSRTQDYTEAITSIFFHPKLDQFLVRKKTVYRGIVLEDKKFVANYEEGATIITTTFLSTSADLTVAKLICENPGNNGISIFCTYSINNTHRRTALDIRTISHFNDEQEILILRYVPFVIKSIKRLHDGRKMEICFDECEDH